MAIRFLARLDVKGSYAGQGVMNTLWYEVDDDGNSTNSIDAMMRAVADAFQFQVQDAWRAAMLVAYTLEVLTVTAFDMVDGAQLAYTPYDLGVGLNGLIGGDSNGPAPCAVFSFTLGTAVYLEVPNHLARRAYLALGPIGDPCVNNDGSLNTASAQYGTLDDLRVSLATSIIDDPATVICNPIRATFGSASQPPQLNAFRRVTGCVLRQFASFRRSRKPRGLS